MRPATVTTTVPNVMSLYVVAGTEAGANQYVYDPAHGGTLGFNSGAVPYRYDAVLFDAVTRKIGLDVDAVIRPAYKGELARSSSSSAAKAGEGWRRLG
jgi:hypothetical protein